MQSHKKIIAQNKKASFDYFFEDIIEAGIVLLGSEVKSIRMKSCNIAESHADITKGEAFIYNMNISPYESSSSFSKFSPTRPRKLLLNSREIRKIIGKIKQKGYTLVPVSIYFNEKNLIKIELAIAKGKKLFDKREDIKQKDWKRQQSRLIRKDK
jgi:SsrA-binding protein